MALPCQEAPTPPSATASVGGISSANAATAAAVGTFSSADHAAAAATDGPVTSADGATAAAALGLQAKCG